MSIIKEVCEQGPGHYLGHPQTLKLMERDYVYPMVGDRLTPKEWSEQGSKTILCRAVEETERLLRSYYPAHLSPDVDKNIRSLLNIKLPKSLMRPSGAPRKLGS